MKRIAIKSGIALKGSSSLIFVKSSALFFVLYELTIHGFSQVFFFKLICQILITHIEENDLEKKQHSSQEYLFVNRSRNPLTRAGISYIIEKYVKAANENGAEILINVHPHVFRHSKAVHLLESGVELIYIRDILGHSSVTTTEIYAKVCTANKRAALAKAYENVADQSEEDWADNKDLMSWLSSLSKKA